MADMEATKIVNEVEFQKYGRLPAGTQVKITVGTNDIFDRTVPPGKIFIGYIHLVGELRDV